MNGAVFRARQDDASEGAPAAPHVRAAVVAACGADPSAVDEMLFALTAEQRGGSRVLPDPLPLVPAISRAAASHVPLGADPAALLMIALCERGRAETFCAIAGCGTDDVALSPLAQVVEFTAGTFRFADPALRIHLIGTAAEPARLAAHQRLAAILAATTDQHAALHHRARSAVLSDPDLVAPLLDRAAAALQTGDAQAAWSLAAEAVDHAEAGTLSHSCALLCAGRAALAGGWVADALACLEHVLGADDDRRADAVAGFVLAFALRHGSVPAPESLIPAEACDDGYRHAAALGALLAAERGDHERSAAWLAVGGRMVREAGARAPLLAWCDALAGVADPGSIDAGEGVQRVVHALSAGLDGDPDAGVRTLAEPGAAAAEDGSAGLHDRSPLLRARRAVAETLLHVWSGRIGVARDLLAAAAAELPVALPFAGLAVALARRLELAVDGCLGPLSRDLAAAVPWAVEPDGFVDRAIDAYLQGRSDEAAVHMRIWTDRGRPSESLGVPGLDEIGPLGARAPLEPPDATAARSLRERIRSARDASWSTDLDSVAEQSRTIRSPFDRARVEALLGSSCVVRGDHAGGVRHLRAARSLFDESGARAWRGMVEERLRRLGELRRPTRTTAVFESPSHASAPLEVCRAAWEPILTPRELDVALRMAEGRTNREIALALHVSVRTVEVHGGRIFAKLDVRTRHELTVLALRSDQHL
ncbi:helix-turn-helix transcriptional regulator [Microbacterium panaciterrae]